MNSFTFKSSWPQVVCYSKGGHANTGMLSNKSEELGEMLGIFYMGQERSHI